MRITNVMREQALKHLDRLYQGATPEQIALFDVHRNAIFDVCAYSDFIARSCISDREMLANILRTGVLTNDERACSYEVNLKKHIANAKDDTEFRHLLRTFRRQEMVIIAWRELMGKSRIEESFRHLSILAETIIIITLDWLYERHVKMYGTPYSYDGQRQQRLLVMGMGKLGGEELNFSSDIDLIFVYPERGETIGGRKAVDNQVFFTRLAQQFIQTLNQQTADGFVYRVDMRLRPFGDSGPMVSTFAAMEDYYLKHGRSWERYAMVKGRVLGPESNESRALCEMLRPFVYRRYLDFSAVESLRKMKALIEAEVRRRALYNNFKLGSGGIREIEFIAQVFQLMRGGRIRDLQKRHLPDVLHAMAESGCAEKDAVAALLECYIFLRRTENILQEINDEQTQTLPESPLNCDRLALAMNTEDYEAFLAKMRKVNEIVHNEFALLIADPNEQKTTEDPLFSDLWLLQLNIHETADLVRTVFLDKDGIESFAELLVNLRNDCATKPLGPRGRDILNRLMPHLLKNMASLDSGLAQVFGRLAKFILSICTRTTYLQLLQENPFVTEHLIRLCGGSMLIAEQLTEHPILLDELLVPQNLYKPTDPKDYPAELRQYLLRVERDDLEQQMEALRQFKQVQLLRICAADLVGALPLMKVSDYLTYLAQAILNEVVNLGWNQLADKYGVPANTQSHGDKGICVIAYGKLGGIELAYGSDLDLVFLCDSELDGNTDGENSISDRMFYGRFAQRIMHLFSTRLSSGVLYEVDARLRPEGEAGPLICSMFGYENYLRHKAWTWELQALVRARAVLGPSRLVNAFNSVRDEIIRRPRDKEKLRQEVIAMRDKMRASLVRGRINEFDIKQGFGGMTDIEFIAQYLVLANACEHKDMVLWSDNVRIFEECARLELIPKEQAKALINAYLSIRNCYHKRSLQGRDRVVKHGELMEERALVQDCWREIMQDDPKVII